MVRDVIVAVISVAVTLGVVGYAQDKPAAVLRSTVFDWDSFPVRNTDVGLSRQVVRQPTITLDELEMHVTTLNAGLASHPPHKHTNEELLILKAGRWRRSSMASGRRSGRARSCSRRQTAATA